MGRLLYAALLRLHPRQFRERFGTEMMGIFDDELQNGASIRLLLDGAISVLRQHALRRTRPEPACSSLGPGQLTAMPLFYIFESRPHSRTALVNGAILSLVLFALVSLAVERGRAHFPQLLIGAKYPRPHVLAVDRSSVMEADPTTEIKIKAPAVDPSYQLADLYFKTVRVLDVLDADRDRTISAWEIVTSASPLRRLDRNGDGKLSAEECGFSLGDNAKLQLDREFVERVRLEFMRTNPVLAVLDVNGNGEISAEEIQHSSVALRTLDQNHDGSLTLSELLPEAAVQRAAMILHRLDTNRDGKLSQQEWTTDEAGPLRGLFERTDRNGDGLITAAELTEELRFQDELKRQTDMAIRSIGDATPRRDSQTSTRRK